MRFFFTGVRPRPTVASSRLSGPGLRAFRSDFDLQRQSSFLSFSRLRAPEAEAAGPADSGTIYSPFFSSNSEKSISLLYRLSFPSIAIQVSLYQRECRPLALTVRRYFPHCPSRREREQDEGARRSLAVFLLFLHDCRLCPILSTKIISVLVLHSAVVHR